MSSPHLAEAVGLAAAPEIVAPVALFNETADSTAKLIKAADNETTRTAIRTTGDVAMTAIPVVGSVATNYTNTVGKVATSAIGETSTVLSFPMRMAGMAVGVVLIVVGVLLVLIAIAVISAQTDKTAGVMIFVVGFLMAGGGGFLMYRISTGRIGGAKKASA